MKKKTEVAVLRDIIGFSALEFADLVGLSLVTVKQLESGEITLNEATAEAIALHTGVAKDWLLAGKPEAQPYIVDQFSGQRIPFKLEYFESIKRAVNLGFRVAKRVIDKMNDN